MKNKNRIFLFSFSFSIVKQEHKVLAFWVYFNQKLCASYPSIFFFNGKFDFVPERKRERVLICEFRFRFVQNLVFYGVSQSTGSWGFDPYRMLMKQLLITMKINWFYWKTLVSFTISACVEILSYVVLHLTLNRVGRKWPYFVAVLLFATIALLTIPVQSFMTKNSRGSFEQIVNFLVE